MPRPSITCIHGITPKFSCKKCISEYSKNYRKNHNLKIKDIKYYLEHEKECRERQQSWNLRHPDYQKSWKEKHPEYDKKYYKNNSEQQKEQVKLWRKNNPEKYKEQARKGQAKRKRSLGFIPLNKWF